MQLTDILSEMGGLKSMARELGVSEGEVQAGAGALLPAILGGFKKQAQAQPSGLEGLGGLLGKLGGGGLLDNVLSSQPTDVSQGNDVLGEIFGSREVSRTVAQNAAVQTGVSADLLKKMLPMLAMLVAGSMAKQRMGEASTSSAGGLGDMLGGLLGNRGGSTGHGLGSLLDMNGDGNALDDILRLAGKAMR